MDQTAITYPYATVNEHDRRDDQDDPRGRRRQPVQSRSVLPAGRRHGARRRPALRDRPGTRRWASASRAWRCAASRSSRTSSYKVAGWAPVAEEAKAAGGEPVWDVVARYLRAQEDDRAARAQPACARRRRSRSGSRIAACAPRAQAASGSADGHARELALAGLHDDRRSRRDDQRLVGDDVAVRP